MNVKNKRSLINNLAEDVAVDLLRMLKKECKNAKSEFSISDSSAIKNIKEMLSAISTLCDKPMRVCADEETEFSDSDISEIAEFFDGIS